jgi:hypothetical protein
MMITTCKSIEYENIKLNQRMNNAHQTSIKTNLITRLTLFMANQCTTQGWKVNMTEWNNFKRIYLQMNKM